MMVVCPLVGESFSWFVGPSVGWFVPRLVSSLVCLLDYSVLKLVGGSSVGPSLGLLIGLSVDQCLVWYSGSLLSSLTCWSVGLLLGWSVLRSLRPAFGWSSFCWSVLLFVGPSVSPLVVQFVPWSLGHLIIWSLGLVCPLVSLS